MRVLTWNIASIIIFKFLRFIKHNGKNIDHWAFHPFINADFVSKLIGNINPDIIFLQEFQFKEDAESINGLIEYPYKTFILTSLPHNTYTLIASKQPFVIETHNGITLIKYENIIYIPIHLHAFSSRKRSQELINILGLFSEGERYVIIGDANMASRGSKYIFSKDRKSYKKILSKLNDITSNIKSTTIFLLSLDKVFVSKDINIKHVERLKERGKYMDHYPVYFYFE
ncbi:MAG: hypothetical protein JWN37_264 [Candidatus Nomurabacteria bacterium]|nr:hypothetical protein [Candidatus Nomurabacteria bacterium]